MMLRSVIEFLPKGHVMEVAAICGIELMRQKRITQIML